MQTSHRSLRPVPWLTELGVAGFFLLAVAAVVAGFFLLAVAAVVARPGFDPVRRYISEYAVGPGGWVMRVAFVLLGVASLNLAAGFLGPGVAARGRRVAGALGVWGAADLVAAAFPVDLQGAPVTGTGLVHLAAAGVGFLALFIGMAMAVRALRESPGFDDLARPTRWAAVLTPVAFVLEASVFETLGWVGAGQWLLFGLAGGWVLVVGRRFRRAAGPGAARP